jgi:hypothetical protein
VQSILNSCLVFRIELHFKLQNPFMHLPRIARKGGVLLQDS